MYLLRSVQTKDLEDIYELSQLVLFINLPAEREVIHQKIRQSLKTFEEPSSQFSENYYLFVLEDLRNSKVIGVSQIHGQHGTEDEPHYFLRVGREEKYSHTLNTGFVHGTLKFDFEPHGHTEIGALVLSPHFRGFPNKLGKQLSFVRFLYMFSHKYEFTPYIHSELMPPFDSQGRSPLWEALGRRFLNMEYHEADVLSRKNREFILNLFPSDTIYIGLLSIEARDAIGKVGEETRPVKKMLEDIGFEYTHEVDPFDGGPHYRAALDQIRPIREGLTFHECKILSTEEWNSVPSTHKKNWLINLNLNDYQFSAVMMEAQVIKNASGHCLNISQETHQEIFNHLNCQLTDNVQDETLYGIPL